MSEHRAARRNDLGDLLVTGILAAAYFAYLLVWVGAPQVFAKPAWPGHAVPWGMIWGAALILAIMIMAGVYMLLRNRSDRKASSP